MIFELTLSDKNEEVKLFKACIKARTEVKKWNEPYRIINGRKVKRYETNSVKSELRYHFKYYICYACGKKNRYVRIPYACNHIKTRITIGGKDVQT